jgi:cytochrome c oxidase assembly protein subunit 15
MSDVDSGASRWLARFAWLAVFYNVAVVVWGALVRATGSGAGCGNHWPLCNGQVIPVSPGFHTVIEFTHRMMTGGSLFVVLALLVWTFRATTKRDAARFFAVASTALLLNEAFLGALLVKLGYVTDNRSVGRMVVLSVHLSNTLLLLAGLTLTARALSLATRGTPQQWLGMHRARGFGWAVTGLVATILVGVSGSMAALGDTLFPATSLMNAFAEDSAAGSPLLIRLRILHPVSALAAALFVVWLVVRSRGLLSAPVELNPSERTRLARSTGLVNLVILLLILQFALGIGDLLLLTPAWMQLLHLLGADLYWIALVLLAGDTIWPAAETFPVSPTATDARSSHA